MRDRATPPTTTRFSAGIVLVFLVREIHLRPGVIGLLSMVGLLGAIAASFSTQAVAARLGHARALLLASVLSGVGFMLFALAGPGWKVLVYVAATVITSFCIVTTHILQVSARQMLSPDEMLGRVGATIEFTIWGVMPLGSILGGVMATVIGLRPTILIDGIAILLASLWMVFSPLRSRRDLAS